jgi:type IV pilus assembly protein PilW
MHCSRENGFSIVELMVAVVIGLIGSIIIFQVYASFEGQKRSSTAGGDVQTNLAIATASLERAGRHAGYGINFKSHLGCDAIVWQQESRPPVPPAVADPGKLGVLKLVPVDMVRDAGGNLTELRFVGGNNDSVYSITELSTGMDPDTDAPLKVRNIYGFDHADVLVLAEKKDKLDALRSDKITCAVMQVRNFAAPVAPETKPSLDHTIGAFVRPRTPTPPTEYTKFNKAGGLGTLTNAQLNDAAILSALDLPFPDAASARFKFGIGASVMNLGQPFGNLGMRTSTFKVDNGRLLENGNPVVDGIVFMEAQYGKAASPTATSVSYIKNMPMDTTKDPKVKQSDWFSLRTVRIVLIARVGQYEKEEVSPASYTFWGSPDPHGQPVTYNVPANDRHYRHQAIELVIPLRNMFWRPQ